MTLKWSLVLVAAFIATVSAQTTTAQQPMPTTSSSMMAAATSTMAPVASPTPTATPEPVVGELDERFNLSLAEQTRFNHFYCLDANGSRADFRDISEGPYRWGLWIQYPVLSYLDSMRKRHLFYVISRLTTEDIFDNICVAEVEHYGVSSYSESVFVKLYIRNQPFDTALETYTRLNEQFISMYNAQNSPYITDFLGRRAINVNSTEPSDNGPVLSQRTVNDSVLAGCDAVSCPEGDPTLLAVVLGTYVGRWYYGEGAESEEVTVELLRSGSLGTSFSTLEPLANNPRPINFGLEAGDIVFAIFGSIFLTLLAASIVIGFFVHPFFFA